MPGQRIRVHLKERDSLFELVIELKEEETKLLFEGRVIRNG